jgi:hypothetical protein
MSRLFFVFRFNGADKIIWQENRNNLYNYRIGLYLKLLFVWQIQSIPFFLLLIAFFAR